MGNGPLHLQVAERWEPLGKVLTIGAALEPPYSGWCWLYCGDYLCGHMCQ